MVDNDDPTRALSRRYVEHRRRIAAYLAEVDKLQDYERPPLRQITGVWIDEAEDVADRLSANKHAGKPDKTPGN